MLDTNVISELMRPNPDESMVLWLDTQKGKDVWVCSITRAEILAGLAMMPEGKRKQGLMEAAAAMFDEDFASRCLPFDGDAANHYASIVQNALGKVSRLAWKTRRLHPSPDLTDYPSQPATEKILLASKDWL